MGLFARLLEGRKATDSGTIPTITPTAIPELLDPGMLLANATRAEVMGCMRPGLVAAEIGTASGNFAAELVRDLKPSKLYLVDPWRWNDDSSDMPLAEADARFRSVQERFAKEIAAGQVQLCRALSTEAAASFPDEHFDLVYIDANHSYEACLADLRAWAPKVKRNGLICGHDYQTVPEARDYGNRVIEAVNEFVIETGYDFLALTFDGAPSYFLAKDRASQSDFLMMLAHRHQVMARILNPERKRFRQVEVPGYATQQAKVGLQYIFSFD